MSSSFRSRRTLPIEEDGEDAPRADLLPGHQRSDRRSASSTNLDQHVVLGSHSPGHVVVDLRPTAANVDGGGKLELDPVGRMPVHFVLAFHDLTYNVGRPRRMAFWRRSRHVETDATTARGGGARAREGALLLDGVSGEAREGEIMAVLGASGAGKTTLIDALADRIQRDSLRGAVTLNGEPLGGRMLKVISAYVMQDDLLYPMLTVAETLMYSAEFRLPRSLSASKKATRVQELIDQLGLRAAANTIIGDEGRRGVSGGERRRVSIGIDIIHDPIILFLDEPTSGLDSTSAFMVVKVLQGIAKSGSVVIMSIHQPSYRIIGLIDRLMFLSRGRTVYYGPPASLPLFFSEFGHPIPDGQNPVEFALDHVRQLEAIPEGTDELVEFSKAWREKALARALFLIRLATVVVTAFILATVFWRLDNTPKGVNERFGFFAIAVSTMFYTSADALPVFLVERYIYLRETAHNAYRRSSYTVSNAIVAFPPLVALSLAFTAITFFAVGLAGGAGGFLFFALIVLASFWAGSGFVTFLSGVVPHVIIGYTVVVAGLAYFLLLSGFFITRDRIPSYWIWLHYLSLIKYPYEAVMQNEFGAEAGRCFMRGVQMFDGTPMARLPVETKVRVLEAMSRSMGLELNSGSCITTGPDILARQAVTELGKWSCLWVTVAWGFLFRALFYLTLVLGSRNRRR
uniref:ABC transporter G family member 5 n=1 Tax=Oryza barthii TaxID=65489 RepID=A0A0D3FH01_9ORYZ